MLEIESGVEAIKSRGLRVVRAVIPKTSKLLGTNASETNFRLKYKAAIVAVQRDGKSVANKLSQARFAVGDVLVLQASDDSPLLVRPPKDFYRKAAAKGKLSLSRYVKRRLNSFGSGSDLVALDKSDNQSDDGSSKSPKKKAIVDENTAKEKSIASVSDAASPQPKFEFDVESDNDDASAGGDSQNSEVSISSYWPIHIHIHILLRFTNNVIL